MKSELMKRELLIATMLGALSTGAFAQQTMGADTEESDSGNRQTKTFTELDSNSDGVLEEDEAQESNFNGEFSDLDRDGDGEVNRNEYYQYYREQSNLTR